MQLSRSHGLRLTQLLAALLCACADDDPTVAPAACGQTPCSAMCDALQTDCDILDDACRARVFAAVVCVRGTPGEPPEVRVITEDEYRSQLEENLLGDAGSAMDASSDVGADGGAALDASSDASADAGGAEPDPTTTWSDGLRLLRLLAPDTSVLEAAIDDRVTTTAGFYSGAERAITLIDRGAAQDSASARNLLAHEFVHALQDQQFGLEELRRSTGGTIDGSTAVRCLTEGEADHYADLASGLLEGFSVNPELIMISAKAALKFYRDRVALDENPYYGADRLVYPVGHAFVADAWLLDGNAGVQRLLGAPPVSTVQFIRGYGEFRDATIAPIQPLSCGDAQGPGDGYELYSSATLGAFQVFGLLTKAMVDDGIRPSEEAWRHASRWSQDRLALFSHESGEVAVSWRMRFVREEVAGQVADAFERRIADDWSDLRIRRRAAEIELLGSTDPELREAWQGTDPEACPSDQP